MESTIGCGKGEIRRNISFQVIRVVIHVESAARILVAARDVDIKTVFDREGNLGYKWRISIYGFRRSDIVYVRRIRDVVQNLNERLLDAVRDYLRVFLEIRFRETARQIPTGSFSLSIEFGFRSAKQMRFKMDPPPERGGVCGR